MIALHITKNMQLYERTLGQWLEHWAETTPDKEYIVYSDRNLRFTWKQFNKRVDDMAKGLIGKRYPRRNLGSKRTGLAYLIICLRKDRCSLRNGKHQL